MAIFNFQVSRDPSESEESFASRLELLQAMADQRPIRYPENYVGPNLVESAWWQCGNCGKRHVHHIRQHFCYEDGGADVFLRRKAEFVGMLRIRNESRWIAKVIESALALCSELYIMDDHSTDGTPDICSAYPQVRLYVSPFSTFNESRDKNWLYDQLTAAVDADWVLAIDGDEVLERQGPTIIRETIAQYPNQAAFKLKIAFLWNSENTVRVDRIYNFFYRPSLFKPFNPGHRFLTTPFGRNGANLHCSSVPQRLVHEAHIGSLCHARLLHYGYLHRADRIRKYDWYTSIDWKNDAEDWYRHIVAGDSPRLEELPHTTRLVEEGMLTLSDVTRMLNVPAEMRMVHAGPLELRQLVEVE